MLFDLSSKRARRARASFMAFVTCATLVGGRMVPAHADTVGPIDFESYATGTVNNQDGWSSSGAAGSGCATYDHAIVDNSTLLFGAPPSFGNKSLRISDAVTSGCFGDQTFSKKIVDEVGEPTADAGAWGSGTRLRQFSSSFDFASVTPLVDQVGLHMSVSADRGDGARMSYVRIEDSPSGWNLFFDDYKDVPPLGSSGNLDDGCGTGDDFIETQIASGVDRTVLHNLRVDVTTIPGPHNDAVLVYLDGTLIHTGTSWEDYFRYCSESGGGTGGPLADQSRTMRSILFRTAGTANPTHAGLGFLIDNVHVSSSKESTSLAYTGNTSGTVGHYTTLSATLSGAPAGEPLAGKLVTFTLGTGAGAQTVTATTDATGLATTSALVPNQNAGAVPLSASFAGDSTYFGSAASPSYTLARASTALALAPIQPIFVNGGYTFKATLTSPVVTTSGTTNVGVMGRAVKFTVCPQPSGTCFSVNGGATNASGQSTATGTFTRPPAHYAVTASFNGAGDPRYASSASAPQDVRVYAWLTKITTAMSGGQYHGAVVVGAQLSYKFHTSFVPAAGKTLSFYRMPSATATNVGTGHLIGTAITGSDGTASVAYRMDTLASPPAAGTNVYFAVTFAGTADLKFRPAQSSTVARRITQRSVTNTLAATRSGPSISGSVTLVESAVTYTTRSNGTSTMFTINGPVRSATVVVQWLNASDAVVASFTVTTDTNGVASFSKAVRTDAVKLRASYAGNANDASAVSNTVTY